MSECLPHPLLVLITILLAFGGNILRAADPHAEVFAADPFPTAAQCAVCHKQIFEEWASSNHAYASISPMFHKFEQKINDLSQSAVGFACMRCHGPVGAAKGEPREKMLWERTGLAREGVTCITCHRIKEESKFEQISGSEFCVSCHQESVHPGIKLDVIWDPNRASPAFAKGIGCQECHMGVKPGVPSGYEKGPAAIVNGKVISPVRDHHNHSFYGPGYPIAHPGIFPHNLKNKDKETHKDRFAVKDWLTFDFRAGWGSEAFERKIDAKQVKAEFPREWVEQLDRQEAREILDENLKKLEYKRDLRKKIMENGSHLDGPFFEGNPARDKAFSFSYVIRNTNSGHSLPSGSLGAQPEIWLNVALISPSGKTVFESGYVDSNGDLADLHSQDVAAGKLRHDSQLVNLQSRFLTTNVKGTDREMYRPINLDIDQLPFIRPSGAASTLLNHPPFVRMEGRGIPPLGERTAKYIAPRTALAEAGTYKLAIRMRSRAEPIYFMKFCNATMEMEQAMNEWMIDIHAYTVEFDVK